jgi:hypothetical protein
MRTNKNHGVEPSPRPRRWRRRLLLAGLIGTALVLLSGLGALAAESGDLTGLGLDQDAPSARIEAAAERPVAERPVARSVVAVEDALVTLAPGALRTVPRSFLGISTEYWGLPEFERQMSVLERTLSLLRPAGGGPLVLRVGGDSADHSFWVPKVRPMPSWAFALTPAWLERTSALVRELSLRLILDLNLVTDTPHAAAQWARAAETQLPRGSITGFEIGNEPDIYDRDFWLATVSHSKVVPPIGLSPRTYAHDFQTYARALRRVAPGVPLLGPALALPSDHRRWISTLIASRPAHVAVISVHRYPYSGCALPGTRSYATIGRVLSENASAGVARSVRPAVAAARRAGDPVRLTELNSVTCGGRPGVSNAFATALWAPDALFELLRAGVSGVNIHVRAHAVNAAFAIGAGGLDARPLLYGLATFTRTLGPGARLVPLNLHASGALHLKAWGVSVRGGGLHVLLIDKGGRPVDVSLRLPAIGVATVQRLLAPSPAARSGVTLAGQYLGPDASWQGRAIAQTVGPSAYDRYSVAVPRYSAALVTLRLRAGALSAAPAHGRVHLTAVEARVPVVAERTRRRGESAASQRRHRRGGLDPQRR